MRGSRTPFEASRLARNNHLPSRSVMLTSECRLLRPRNVRIPLMKLSEISSSLCYRAHIRRSYRWFTQGLVTSFAAWLVHRSVVFVSHGGMTKRGACLVVLSAVLVAVAILRLWIRHCRRGVAAVDWDGVASHGFFGTRYIPWSAITALHGDTLSLGEGRTFLLKTLWITQDDLGQLMDEIRRRRHQSD